MVNMSAKFDEDVHNGKVWTTAALLHPLSNTMCGDNNHCWKSITAVNAPAWWTLTDFLNQDIIARNYFILHS